MTRTINIYAHDVTSEAFQAFAAEVEAAVKKLRESNSGKSIGGSIYDSDASPQNRNL